MKKVLLGTTALVGALLAAQTASAQMVSTSQPFTITIGGFSNVWLGILGNEEYKTAGTVAGTAPNGGSGTMDRSYDLVQDTEIWVTIQAKADNGLVYGLRLELEADSSLSNNSDEANIFIQGGFGRVELGEEDSFEDRWFSTIPFGMTPPSGNALGSDGGIIQYFVTRSIPYLEALVKPSDTSDATKISYASPVFGGFQAGVSWSPDGRADGVPGTGSLGRDRLDTVSATDVGSAANGESSMLTRSGYENFVESVAQWSGTFGGFGVRLLGAYNFAQAKDGVGALNYRDISSWGLGAGVTWGGLTVGANYVRDGKSRYLRTGAIDSDAAWGFAVGAQYAIGPWTIGGNFQTTESEGDTTAGGNDKLTKWEAGVGYLLAPGLTMYLNYVNFDIENEGTQFNEGDLFLLATRVAF